MRVVAAFVLVVGVGLLAGCAPFAHHGPWVREGVSADFMTAGGVSVDPGGEHPVQGFAFGVDGALRYGVAPENPRVPAFSAGLQFPFAPLVVLLGEPDPDFKEWVTGDVYVAGPRTQTLATSVGFSGSFYHKLPYFQVGSRSPNPKGWYTTQAFMLREDGFKMWLPTFTWVTPAASKPRASHLTVGGGLGQDDGDVIYMFMAGITMEFYRTGARVR